MVDEFVDRHPLLLHRVALPHGGGPVVEGVEVDGDAERRADLVLATVAATDGLGLVVVAHPVRLQQAEHLAGRLDQLRLLGQGQHGHRVGGEAWVEAQDGAQLAAHLLLVVGGHEERHGGTGGAGSGLDDVGDVLLVGCRVEVFESGAGRLGMAQQVEVGAVGDALELVPAPREQELDVGGGPRVVAQLVALVDPQTQLVGGHAEIQVPVAAHAAPVLEPFLGVVGGHEELELHLLELAGPEHEVARGDLVAKRLADLGDAERRPLAAGVEHVGEVGEHALGGLGPQVDLGGRLGDGSGMGLEHEVELAGLGEGVSGAAVRAGTGVVELVLAVAGAAFPAVDQRVGEACEVARRLPHGRRRQDRGVEPDDVVAHLHHRPPPPVLDIAQQQHADRPVVVGRAEAAVDLGRLEHEATPLGEVDDLVEQRLVVGDHGGAG